MISVKAARKRPFSPGAAPITLINGNKLIELLFEHEVGIRKQSVTLYEVDEEFFSESAEEDEIASKLESNAGEL